MYQQKAISDLLPCLQNSENTTELTHITHIPTRKISFKQPIRPGPRPSTHILKESYHKILLNLSVQLQTQDI